jgi:hypothetical protein
MGTIYRHTIDVQIWLKWIQLTPTDFMKFEIDSSRRFYPLEKWTDVRNVDIIEV